jgi:signal transduction histidine kinase
MGARPACSDYMISLGFAAVALVEIAVTPSAGLSVPERVSESAVAILIGGCFLFRRLYPVWSALLVLGLLSGGSVAWTDGRVWDIAAVMLASYACARHASSAGSWVELAAAAAYGLLVCSLEPSDDAWMYIGNFLFVMGLMVAIPWAAGRALRRRQELSRSDAEKAVDGERARIARELHDVVGHALGMIVVQAEGERAQLDPDAPESTRETLATIAQGARDALDDVRRLLAMMRVDNDLGPQPGLRDVPRLLEGLSSAGLPIELQVSGASRQLPAGVDLSAYRVVQEALTNVLRHSRDAHARVLLSYDPDAIGIEVIDDGKPAPSKESRGFGLLGMRERVALFGGRIETGPRPGGGFGVHVHLPTRGGGVDDTARTRV